MERQLPKNVRQIGNVCDEPKIYVEDYVDTFLGQLQEKAMEKPVAAALTGEITKCEDKVVVYISGAIRAEDVEVEGTNHGSYLPAPQISHPDETFYRDSNCNKPP